MVQPLWKTTWWFLKKLRIELSYDPTFPLLWVYPKKKKTLTGKAICTSMFITASSTIAKIQKQPKCPSMDEWIKIWCIYTMEYYSAIQKKLNIAIYNNMDGP